MSEQETEERSIEEVREETPPPQEAPKTQEKEKRRRKFNIENFRAIAEAYKWIKRASQGLDLDPDKYEGMMDVKDIRERTRISAKRISRSTYCRILAKSGEKLAGIGNLNPYAIFDEVAEMEDKYFIAKDGEQRKEAILLRRTETQTPSAVANISLPQIETKPPEAKKSHFWNRNKSGGEQKS